VIADVLITNIRPGSIVLLHDVIFDKGRPVLGPVPDRISHVDRSAMLEGLDLMFQKLSAEFQFVTIPELLRHGVPYRSFWFKQTSLPEGLGPIERALQRIG
jgi:hypothetical protein